jgi:hypothetical protein
MALTGCPSMHVVGDVKKDGREKSMYGKVTETVERGRGRSGLVIRPYS